MMTMSADRVGKASGARSPAMLRRAVAALTVVALAGLAPTSPIGAQAPKPAPAAAAPAKGKGAEPPVTPPDGVVKSQFGDWQLVCKGPPPGAKQEVCALVQSVTAEDRSNVGLTVYIQKFSSGQTVLRVFAPLGVLLPRGLGLKIDNTDVGNAPFLRCHSFACYAQVVLEEKLIQQLVAGKTAVFIIFQTEEQGIGIPISLSGFAQAIAALK